MEAMARQRAAWQQVRLHRLAESRPQLASRQHAADCRGSFRPMSRQQQGDVGRHEQRAASASLAVELEPLLHSACSTPALSSLIGIETQTKLAADSAAGRLVAASWPATATVDASNQRPLRSLPTSSPPPPPLRRAVTPAARSPHRLQLQSSYSSPCRLRGVPPLTSRRYDRADARRAWEIERRFAASLRRQMGPDSIVGRDEAFGPRASPHVKLQAHRDHIRRRDGAAWS